MREGMGLYKAKRKDNGKWIQGYLFCIWEKAYILWGTINGIPDMVEVDPDTACEWTGLVDKNGVKIFEGDKVRYPDSSSTFNDYEVSEGFVEWDAECMCFYFTNRFIIEMDEFDIVNGVMVDVEVIGSIHDKVVEE